MKHLPKKSQDFEENKKHNKKVLLMYSGGVDTSISVYLLKHFYGYQVITLTIDVCQDTTWAKRMAKKAKKLGAVKTIIYDGKQEYANNYLSQIIKANALYDDYYPVGTSIARPWQAKLGVDIAKKENVDAIAHGNKGRGAGAFQFNMVFNYFSTGDMKLVTPIGDWWPTRQEEVEFAFENNIPIPVPKNNPFSYDDNIMSNAINYGDIDDIGKQPPEEAFKWTVPIEKAPDKPEYIELEFKNGLPIKLNNQKIKLSEMIQKLNIIAGKHGIGRIDMIENGLYGNKFKWVYEAPAAQILIYCHKEIEKLVLPKETINFKHEFIDKKWVKLVYHALVYSPLAKALMSFINHIQPYVNGKIDLKLYKGNFIVMKRESGNSLVNIDSKNLKLKLDLDTIPYGFEEYSFALKHPEVFTIHLGKLKVK
ncbi:argininosuccinate synthase [Candidatus Roizmanbacteria bacterium RIFCSPHIGHO2_01_FULL_35_10]|uniref:argininosuccinate synthase n=1 Tax=Candidatus Roizmanbacteria bacterium RIFCSPLOWO2_01_FULL_35_13 TaxID=1802055 RepID=A0A1F7IAL0_9BACT|nr:MAG: argininosuccinate synthase [Candidatus Roizmanbacteria bacterium RIFCSPHIGHO2_01_FULL_35_10]OGK40405.1 MAG: argininosuccinate synthase [Candidatus Roizmanbacteria bacterium RIFCSPLOWO2_01_FULL_35_13]